MVVVEPKGTPRIVKQSETLARASLPLLLKPLRPISGFGELHLHPTSKNDSLFGKMF
jgi:hypothetical protein